MLHHTPGHTPGSIMMELSMEHSGTVLFTGDLFHVKENWEDGIPQTGSLMRDYSAWARSSQFAKRLAAVKRAKVILGHEGAYFDKFPKSPQYLE
jgi:glyoxylase-like metal-dependent hydrolase (beta-lactamase superfamily II)